MSKPKRPVDSTHPERISCGCDKYCRSSRPIRADEYAIREGGQMSTVYCWMSDRLG